MAKVSIVDVARVAGVSVSTVSLVLRKKGHISQPTIERVQCAIDELGYIYNQSAANLRSQKSNLIGLLFEQLDSDFSIKILKTLIQALDKKGFTVMVKTGQLQPPQLTGLLNEFKAQHVAGVILVASGSLDEPSAQSLAAVELPYQMIASYQEGEGMSDLVVCDPYRDGLTLTRFLLDMGHVTTLFLGGEQEDPVFTRRAEGYRAAYRERGIPERKALVITSDRDLAGQRQRLESALRSDNSISALVCHSFAAAMLATQCILKLGYGIGKDFILAQQKYVVCFQEVDRFSSEVMELPYLLLPLEAMTHQAVLQLLERIQSGTPQPLRAFAGDLIC
ncbi:LacI family DNA-binding transcriptional regulator [Aeromonas allosaccharophila]|uniref:LacI family DNA-binding transcriptional regulator n=1 Tax=Aeromonas allosaccharophila TaxID=656 RepID=A0A7T2PFT8_9GAMM|nr:LacI family DNA-binding transcriptional regulator [Aeromonas allosaccharophila]QPR55003.1 LacI family DNA-binding transcriptional regulator [Aeromonas allosaccharophila]